MRGLKEAAAKGLAVVVMEPLLGGRLASPPESVEQVFRAADPQRTPADWALQWIWNQPQVSLLLSGMSTPDQVDQNLKSAGRSGVGSMSAAEQKVITRARETYQKICPIPCTHCNYCLPCPNGVDIPRNFEYFNKGTILNEWGSPRFRYGQIPAGEKAEACIDCEECESKCPQHIKISDWMPYVHEVLSSKVEYDGRAEPTVPGVCP
jgi:hypothetical protein